MMLESLNSWDVLHGLGIHTSLDGANISVGRETMGLILHILEKLQNDSAASAGMNYHCWAEKAWLG